MFQQATRTKVSEASTTATDFDPRIQSLLELESGDHFLKQGIKRVVMHLPHIIEHLEPFWAYNMPDQDYHSDRTSVGSSQLRKLLKSPSTFLAEYQEPQTQEPTPAMKFGSLVHRAVLEHERFMALFVQPDFGDLRNSANRKKRDEWAARIPDPDRIVTQEDYDKAKAIRYSILEHPDAAPLLRGGMAEVCGYYRDPGTGIKCRIKPDYINLEKNILVDLKTTQDCTLNEFSKSIWNFRYDFQLAMYREGVFHITGKFPDCVIIAVEKQPPFEVGIYHVDEETLARGQQDYHRVLALLKQCIETNRWPRYQNEIQTIGLPSWAFNQ